MTGQDVWYIAREGKQHGPLSEMEMNKLVELGHLKPSDLVWRPGFPEWRAAGEVFTPQPQPNPQPPSSATAPKTEPAAPSSQPAATSKFDVAKMAKPAEQPGTADQTAAARSTQTQTAASQAAQPQQRAESAPAGFWPAPNATQSAPASAPLVVEPQRWNDPRPSEPAAARPQPALAAGERPMSRRPTYDPPEERKGGTGRVLAIGGVLLALIGGGAFAAFNYQKEVRALLAIADAPTKQAKGPANDAKSEPEAAAPAPLQPATVEAAVAPATVPEPPAQGVDEAAIDGRLQRVPLWTLLKTEFPDWYGAQVRGIQVMTNENKPEAEITRAMLEAMVELRRKSAEQALSASTPKLMQMATAFIDNLKAMQSQSVEACYGFISKGETTQDSVDMLMSPERAAPLQKQLEAVFAAAAEGRTQPTPRQTPQKSDYDLLATELGTIGWSQADIQLFADPKALSKAPKDQVCRMVQDWFQAHLAVKDSGAQERLLHETLRAVVAG